MSDVEGVTAEETTAQESVENPAPEKVEVKAEEAEAETPELTEEAEQETVETEGMNDEDLEKVLSDPKVKAYIEKQNKQAIDEKESNRKVALKHKDETILKLKEQISKLEEAKEAVKLDINDFDTQEEFETAQRKQAAKDAIQEEKLDDAKAALIAEEQEMIQVAGESFKEKEAKVMKDDPSYTENAAVVQEYIDMIPQGDEGFQTFSRYIAFDSENGAALINHLGKNPDKIEALLGKPPALIKRKMQAYEKELHVPKTPEKADPLPAPITKPKGAATPKVPTSKLEDPDAYMKWRNSQLNKKRS